MRAAVQRLLVVWALLVALLALSAVSVALSLGPLAPVVNFGIALAKAVLIGWVFMRLGSEPPLARLAAMGALAWVSILLVLTALDYATRT